MSDAFNPAVFFEAVSTFQESAGDGDSKGNLILATVHSYVSGRMRLIIDGEDAPTSKTFNWVGPAPAVGTRVCVAPIANTFLVLGELNNDGINQLAAEVAKRPRGIIAFSRISAPGPALGNVAWATAAASLTATAQLVSGRRYRVGSPTLGMVSNNPGRMLAYLRQNGSTPEVVQSANTETPSGRGGVRYDVPLVTHIDNPATGAYSFSVVALATAAGYTVQVSAGAANPIDLVIEDLGAV